MARWAAEQCVAVPPELWQSAASDLARPCSQAQLLELVCNVAYVGYDPAIDSHIKDRRRIAQMPGNLLANALRHTPFRPGLL